MKHKLITLCLLGTAAALISQAATMDFYASLKPEAAGASGWGLATFSFDTTAQTLAISASWAGLSGETSVSHIHCCTAVPGTGTAGVAVTPSTLPGFPVGVHQGTYSTTVDLTQLTSYTGGFLEGNTLTAAQGSAKLLQGILSGSAYLNIHTLPNFPGGEIRGFLQPVPEPATFAFAGAAIAGVLLSRRFLSR